MSRELVLLPLEKYEQYTRCQTEERARDEMESTKRDDDTVKPSQDDRVKEVDNEPASTMSSGDQSPFTTAIEPAIHPPKKKRARRIMTMKGGRVNKKDKHFIHMSPEEFASAVYKKPRRGKWHRLRFN